MVDVFISYSRTNKDKVGQIARGIEAAGYTVWWDAELPPHQSYGEVITAKIDDAKAAIVVWSAEAAASEWVRAEADMARNQKKLVQTALGDIMPPLPFNQIQYANLGDWNGEADHPEWRKVKQSLTALCGAREAKPGDGPVAPVAAAPAPAPVAAPTQQAAPVTAAAFLSTAPQAKAASKPSMSMMIGIGVGVLGLATAGYVVQQNRQAPAPQQLITQLDPAAPADSGVVVPLNTPPPAPAEPAKPAEAAAPVTAVVSAPAAGPQQVDALNRDITMTNQSGETIMYLYWSNTNQQNWGDDRLGSSVLPNGQQWFVTVTDGSQACEFDIMGTTASGRQIEHRAVNVCSQSEVIFN
jgi:TIR domain